VKAGIIVNLKLLVPCDPRNVDEMAAAAQKAKTLSTVDGLRKLAEGVELVEPPTMHVSMGGNNALQYGHAKAGGAAPEIKTMEPNSGAVMIELAEDEVLVISPSLKKSIPSGQSVPVSGDPHQAGTAPQMVSSGATHQHPEGGDAGGGAGEGAQEPAAPSATAEKAARGTGGRRSR
jgi:hypothetical protein